MILRGRELPSDSHIWKSHVPDISQSELNDIYVVDYAQEYTSPFFFPITFAFHDCTGWAQLKIWAIDVRPCVAMATKFILLI